MQKLIEEYRVLRDRCDAIINTIIPILPPPDNFDFPVFYKECAEWISVDIPLSLEAYRSFRSALGGGWEIDCDYRNFNAYLEGERVGGLRKAGKSFYAQLRHTTTDMILDVNLHPGIAGSTCKMVQVGTCETAVYEVECG